MSHTVYALTWRELLRQASTIYSEVKLSMMESIQLNVKDKIIFCTKADHKTPSKYEVPKPLESEQRKGVVLPNGEINWTCPCLGGLPYGPCGYEFRQFFECLHRSRDTEDQDAPNAQECFPKFATMKECFNQFPKLYPPDEDDDIVESSNKLTSESTAAPKDLDGTPKKEDQP